MGWTTVGKKNKFVMPTDDQLMERGYMTVDQFVDRLSESLRSYMKSNWSEEDESEELHHPEDLAANAATYTEVMYRVIGDFS
jgi:hypothetical protein